MTETITTYSVESLAIASELTELQQLNLKVAAIAGWTDIQEWHRSRNLHPDLKVNKKVFIGTNDNHLELGIFIPDYTKDLNAIATVFDRLDYQWNISGCGYACVTSDIEVLSEAAARTPAIALCKVLIELAPNLPKPELKPTVIEATFE